MILETKITGEKIRAQLDRIIGNCLEISDYNRYLSKECEKYKSKAQYAASKILYAFDSITDGYTDPYNYLAYLSNQGGFPNELKPLLQNHINRIKKIRIRKKAYRTDEENKENEELHAKLKQYRAVYRQAFDKMKIPKKDWWDEKCG